MNEYKYIAPLYDHLMRKISYKNWADYLSDIIQIHEINTKRVLEIGSGTGKLSEFMNKLFEKYIQSDLAKQLLMFSNNKNKLVFDFKNVPFKNDSFSLVFMTFDTFNYALNDIETNMLLEESYRILQNNGVLLFDCSMKRNSISHSRMGNRKGVYGKYKYTQESVFDRDKMLHYNKFYIHDTETDNYFTELHTQRVYDFLGLFEILDGSNFTIEQCYESFTFDFGNDRSLRLQLILRKN